MDSTDSEIRRFYGWITMSMAGLVIFVSNGIWYSFQAFLPVLCDEFSWTRGMVGGAFSVSYALLGLLAPVSGILTAKYGANRTIIVGNLFLALGFLFLFFQTQPWHLYLGFGVLVGIGMGIGGLVPASTLANNWFVRKRSMAMSIVMSSRSVGGFVLLPITTAVLGVLGWRLAFLVLSAIAILFAVVVPGLIVRNKPEDLGQVPDGVAASKPEEEDAAKPPREPYTTPVEFTLGEAIRTRALWMLILIVVTVSFTESMLFGHQIAFLETIGITGMVAATAAGLFSGLGVLGALVIGVLGLRFNIWPLSIASLIFAAIGMSLMLVANSIPMVFLYNIILGTGFGALLTCFFCILSSYYGRTNYPTILGVTVPFASVLGASGSTVAGFMYDATGSYTLPLTLGMFALLVGVVFTILAPPPKHPSLLTL